MDRLGFPEGSARFDHRDDISGPSAGSLDLGDGGMRDRLLFIGDREDRRTIARSDIVALPIERCRIMSHEEELQDFLITRLLRVEYNLECFGMARVMTICRVIV